MVQLNNPLIEYIRLHWPSRKAIAFGVSAFLYALLLVALRPQALFQPAGGAHLFSALLEFFFPVTFAELILLLIFIFTTFSYFRGVSGKPKAEGIPSVSVRSPTSLFCRRNLRVGWSLFWKIYLVGRGFSVIDKAYLAGTALEIPLSIIGIIVVLSLAVWLSKRAARRFYSVELHGYGWPFLWRAAIGTFLSGLIFLLASLVVSPRGITDELVLLDWFTSIPMLVIMQCAVFGWAVYDYVASERT